jgi:hypothetical protein
MLQPARAAPAEPERELSREIPVGRNNGWIAERLRQAASLLAARGANPFRIAAYRRAGDAIARLDADVRDIAEAGGHAALEAIPWVGPSIAGAVAEMLATGRWGFLERLKGAADPEALFCSVPGIGPALAHRIQETLHLDSLEALEIAAHDGRLRQVPGFGARRAAVVRSTLAELLARVRPPVPRVADEPDVALLLDVDREYRDKAASDTLHKIAPRRFNPAGAGPPPSPQPKKRVPRAVPLAGVQRAEPSGGVQGRSPWPSLGSPDCPESSTRRPHASKQQAGRSAALRATRATRDDHDRPFARRRS